MHHQIPDASKMHNISTRRTTRKEKLSIIEKKEELHIPICNRLWMEDVLIHSLIFH